MTEQIWQCNGCGRTYPEYINGCVENHPPPRKVVMSYAHIKPDDVVLECGCFVVFVVEDGDNVAKVSPCHIECPFLADLLVVAAEQDVPILRREAP
jgi:hypothetical protein